MKPLWVWLCLLLLSVVPAFAQDEDDELPPGLLAIYSTQRDATRDNAAAQNHSVRRVDPDIAFVWNAASPDERLAAGPFIAQWTGQILLRGEGQTRWHAFVQGRVEVRIDDKVVVTGESEQPAWLSGDEFELGFGEKTFSATFTRTGDAAQLKLYWSSNEFPLEPLPYQVFFHEKPAPDIALAERGRVQFESHRCANCHGGVDGRGAKVEGQSKDGDSRSSSGPQSSTLDHQPAPSLRHVGQGTSRAWLIDKLRGDRSDAASSSTLPPSPRRGGPGRGDDGSSTPNSASTPLPNPPPQGEGTPAERKMPHFGFTQDEAEAVVAALIDQAQSVKLDAPPKLKDSERDKDLKEGLTLIRSVGCLACHTQGTLGEVTSFGGGSLTNIAQRRTADWLATWLANPSHLNKHARMPVVSLSDKERAQIVLALLVPSPPADTAAWGGRERVRVRGPNGEDASQFKQTKQRTPHPNPLPSKARGEGTGEEKAEEKPERPALVAQGRKLIESSRCSACHELTRPQQRATSPRSLAWNDLDWTKSCLQTANVQPGQPSFPQADEKAIRAYVASWGPAEGRGARAVGQGAEKNNGTAVTAASSLNSRLSALTPARLLEQKNCLACHDRDGSKGLSRLAAAIAKADDTLNGLHVTLIPPRLHAVGDRLHDEALKDAIIGGPKSPRLNWLRVRMPRFQHSDEEQAALVSYLIGKDRVPGKVEGGGLKVEGQAEQPQAGVVPSPPSGTTALGGRERARVRGPSGENAPQLKQVEERIPHPNPLPSKARGEGTGEAKAKAKEPLTLALSPQIRGEGTKQNAESLPDPQRLLAGRELLGGKGFSCVACHAVKDYTPKVTALGTRGSNLHLIGQRMRPEYFYRWTRAPLRIMPGVEMPNYQRPHPTILVNADGSNSLHNQLTAIWEALNDPNLTAPTNPAVVEQLLTVNPGEPARVVRDVFTAEGSADDTVARAFAFGLDNGHSVLFDLDTGGIRAWTLGDFARQRCEGKRWYWDLAGVALATGFDKRSEFLFLDNTSGEVISPENGWLYETEFTQFTTSHDGYFTYQLTVSKGEQKHLLDVREDFQQDSSRPSLGWDRLIAIHPRSGSGELTITPWHRGAVPQKLHNAAAITFAGADNTRPKDLPDTARMFERRRYSKPNAGQPDYFQLPVHYSTTLKRVETASPNPPVPPLISSADRITSVPGFQGERLPLPRSIMPTAMTFDDQSRLIFTSLKGHVYRVDAGGDALGQPQAGVIPSPPSSGERARVRGLNGEDASQSQSAEERTPHPNPLPSKARGEGTKLKSEAATVQLTTLTEGLAAPFGLFWQATVPSGKYPGQPSLIVAHKPELLTLVLKDDKQVREREVFATGWGITDDYHDWTCGIVRDSQGNFFTVLGSDYAFKTRPKEKSRWRGDALKISPRGEVTSFARGLRFPTGIAIDDQDRLFVTDQQGVQNTFNELNHVQAGRRYGVPSRHEPEPDAPAEAPAVQIPHPWTRSVNGVAFVPRRLGTPARPALDGEEKRTGKSAHPTEEAWPFAGHMLAVEYNNNSIIRMSMQEVDGVMQGAVYPFSRPTSATEAPLSATPNSGGKPQPQDSSSFIGPICIGISPTGDIYVGGFQDGGWAGGLNMGDIVKFTPEAALPNGLREIRATSRGFDLEFFHPVDPELARQTNHFKISGYARLWQGDYATPDSGRHTGDVTDVQLDDAARSVSLTVKGLKPGHVYDVSVGEIGHINQRSLWPSLGHYTLHRIPK